MLSAEGLHHAHDGRLVLRGVDVTLARGEVVGLGGASGSGKSTLGRLLAGHLAAQSGRVRLDGMALPRPAPGRAAPVQYAPQLAELAVDPHWRVGRILSNAGPPDEDAVHALGISADWQERHPGELSGGELARVSLARLFHPALRALVCDEVTAQLDALEQAALLDRLIALARRRGIAILLISHSAGLRLHYADRSTSILDGRLVA